MRLLPLSHPEASLLLAAPHAGWCSNKAVRLVSVRRGNIYDGFRWWRRDIGESEYMRELMVRNTTLRGWAGQLLGDLMPEKIPGHGRTRGINVTLPFGDHPRRGAPDKKPNTKHGDYETCHNDAHSMSRGFTPTRCSF